MKDAPAGDHFGFHRRSGRAGRSAPDSRRHRHSCLLPTATSPALAAAWAAQRDMLPSVRLANLRDLRHPLSVDLWLDSVARHAKVVVVRLLGGLDWWRYGVERLASLAREHAIPLALLPGEDRDDPRLTEASTLPPRRARYVVAVLPRRRTGELVSAAAAACAPCRIAASRHRSRAPLPRTTGYIPGEGAVDLERLVACVPARPSAGADHLLSRDAARGRYGADRCALPAHSPNVAWRRLRWWSRA